VGLAVFVAVVGFGVTLVVGQRLVGLEVANQVVEASLRMDLVLLETSPERICVALHNPPPESVDVVNVDDVVRPPAQTYMAPTAWFVGVIGSLRENYKHLYLNFTALNLWLAIFEQFATILPYLLVAPLLFASNSRERVTMGTLIQVSNAFDKVFNSLNVIADNYTAVNEYRSVLRRLRQFELNLYHNVPHPNRRQVRSPPFSQLSEVSLSHLPGAPDDNGERVSTTRV
jgi:ABC-type long-subunit fatty acid transport system fused permease/ATPase subunit